jgi:hypothetical protein
MTIILQTGDSQRTAWIAQVLLTGIMEIRKIMELAQLRQKDYKKEGSENSAPVAYEDESSVC